MLGLNGTADTATQIIDMQEFQLILLELLSFQDCALEAHAG